MSDLQYRIGEYGQTIQRVLNEDVSTASSVNLVCERAGTAKNLTGTIAGDGVTVSFLVTEDFFDEPGIWYARVQANFTTRVSEEKEPSIRITVYP